jgi:predicted phage tail protein
MRSAFSWFGWFMAIIACMFIMVGCCGNCKAADAPLKEQAMAAGKVLLEQANEIAKSNAIEATSAAFKELTATTSTNGTNSTIVSQAKDMTAAAKEKGMAMAGKAKDFAKEAASKFGENTQGWGHEIGQALKNE